MVISERIIGIPTNQREAGESEVKASLLYRANSRTARTIQRDPSLKNKNNQRSRHNNSSSFVTK